MLPFHKSSKNEFFVELIFELSSKQTFVEPFVSNSFLRNLCGRFIKASIIFYSDGLFLANTLPRLVKFVFVCGLV